MDSLPSHLVNEILFRMDLKTLGKMQCTDKSFRSRLSEDPYFKSEYNSRVGSNLFYISSYGSKLVCYLPFFGSTSTRSLETLISYQVLGSCSGLLLLFGQGLCVANPFTKKFRFLDHSKSNLFPMVTNRVVVPWKETTCIGFAVDQIDRTSQRFKIVCVKGSEARNPGETMYQFEINEGDSWRMSKTTVTCRSSNFGKRTRPVYVNGSLHWLRNDGSILAFNLETEKARLVSTKFPQEPSTVKTLFAATDNKLTLIWPTNEVIYVYGLENIFTDPKWVLVRRIGNVVADTKRLIFWNVVAYNRNFLMLREKNHDVSGDVVHQYDLKANKWGVMGYIPKWFCSNGDFYLFTPSSSSVIGLDEKLKPCDDDKRISSLSSIMRLLVGNSSEEKEATQLRKRSIEEEETKLMLKKQRN
ncbi:hypothetical protein CARUB_v10011337mg [Capsella rubella]|uniref:F-box domain-containing protein n=1 Tax=Capsella rubella TaxID=81985 RepID=R0GSP2_9BRAS|nr:putative F-box protein At1g20795 [Capsella rubella]EOA38937.1 hypothetical protein CARUB_v10011337mg [Capsella rubella]